MSLYFILLFLVLISIPFITSASPPTLTKDYYLKTCPNFAKIVQETVTAAQREKPTTASGTLRLFFNDCFMEGCDASVLIEPNPFFEPERDNALNEALSPDSFQIINRIKTAIEESCPGVVSCADILAQTTREFVQNVGGPNYEVELGRKDGLKSEASNVNGKFPLVHQTVPEMLSVFTKNNFTLKELVVLTGAHTIGVAHCKEFSKRIFPKVDPELDPKFAGVLSNLCKDYTENKTLVAFLDPVTPGKFDNMYFKNLKRGLGLMVSDHNLFKDVSTRPFVELYANNEKFFFEDFGRAMEKLGTLGVKGEGEGDGDVRRKCDQLNKK